jgi:hypothetical protein
MPIPPHSLRTSYIHTKYIDSFTWGLIITKNGNILTSRYYSLAYVMPHILLSSYTTPPSHPHNLHTKWRQMRDKATPSISSSLNSHQLTAIAGKSSSLISKTNPKGFTLVDALHEPLPLLDFPCAYHSICPLGKWARIKASTHLPSSSAPQSCRKVSD